MARKILARGSFMRRKGVVWEVVLLKDGIIHLVRDDTGEVDRVTVKRWQQECSEGITEMVGTPDAELTSEERAMRKVRFSDLPGNMRASALQKHFYMEAFTHPAVFYDTFYPDVPVSERIHPRLSRRVLVPFAKLVADAFRRTKEVELVQIFERPGATARRRKKSERNRTPVPAHFLRAPSFSTYANWVNKWTGIMARNGKPDARLMASRYDRRGPRARTMHPRVEEWLEEAIDQVWLTPAKNKKTAVYRRLRRKVDNHNTNNPRDILPLPTERHVRRVIEQAVDRETAVRRRDGDEEADRKFALVGKGPETKYVLETVEVDHTRVDVDILDDETGAKLGRPWRTIALDRATKVPVGCKVHFDGPCISATMSVLADVMTPKNYIKKLVPELDYDYPGYGVPEAFFFDRGSDFDNDYIREVTNEFDISVDYEPVGCPYFKGSIERWHRTSNEQVDHPLPGATPPRDENGFRRDPDGKAYITLSQYMARLWRWIAMVYMKTPHRGLRDTPLNAWRKRENLRLPRPLPDKASLKLLMTRTELLTPRNTGVQFRYLRWNGTALRRIRSLPSFKAGDKVLVRINDENVAEAWVVNPITRESERLEPVYPELMNGLTLYRYRMALLHADEHLDGARDEDSLLEAIRVLDEEADALLATKGRTGKSKAAVGRHLNRRPQATGELAAETPVGLSPDVGRDFGQMPVVAFSGGGTSCDKDMDVLPTRQLRKNRRTR